MLGNLTFGFKLSLIYRLFSSRSHFRVDAVGLEILAAINASKLAMEEERDMSRNDLDRMRGKLGDLTTRLGKVEDVETKTNDLARALERRLQSTINDTEASLGELFQRLESLEDRLEQAEGLKVRIEGLSNTLETQLTVAKDGTNDQLSKLSAKLEAHGDLADNIAKIQSVDSRVDAVEEAVNKLLLRANNHTQQKAIEEEKAREALAKGFKMTPFRDFYFLSKDNATHADAETACANLGSRLAQFADRADMQAVSVGWYEFDSQRPCQFHFEEVRQVSGL